jgi:hypothetical protein
MEITQDSQHGILSGLQWVAMVATASVLYWVFMAAWGSASLMSAFGFSAHRSTHS